MPTEVYCLPNFLALLPEKPGGEINPQFREAEAAFNAWVEKKFGGPSAMEVYQCDNSLAASVTYPLASYQQLRGIIDYMAAGFLLDDLLDRSSREVALALSQLWMNPLRDGSEVKSVQHPVIEMMCSELMLGTRAAVGSFHWPRFIAENEKMFMYMVQETHDRNVYLSKNTTSDIESYIIKRRVTLGTRPLFILIQSTRCLYIPDDVFANPVIEEMENAITDMIFIANDIYSFQKEYRFDGAFSNLLTVIEKDPETAHLVFQERLDYAKTLFEAALERFHACRRELPSFGPEMDQYLASYADGLIDLLTGSLQWSRVNRRYNTFMNDEDRNNNIMRLALDSSPANEKDISVY